MGLPTLIYNLEILEPQLLYSGNFARQNPVYEDSHPPLIYIVCHTPSSCNIYQLHTLFETSLYPILPLVIPLLVQTLNIHTLAPFHPTVTDPLDDVLRFIREYETEYGQQHPAFFQGSYSQALSHAKSELKFLLVYLHCADHQDTPVFCR